MVDVSDTIVFVDPGKWALAVAVWDGPRFRDAVYVEGSRHHMHATVAAYQPRKVVVEKPVSYTLAQQKGDQNDLIDVALSAGAAMAACPVALTFAPGEWKGQVPKHIHHARIDRDLTLPMRAAIARVAKTKQHNLLDAIALGLWWFKTQPMKGQ